MELSNDIIGVISVYTVPSVTYTLITLESNIALRFGYDQVGLWKNKVLYEMRGLIFDDSVINRNGGNYHTYYRIINEREYGNAASLHRSKGKALNMRHIMRGVLGIFQNFNRLYIGLPDRILLITDGTNEFTTSYPYTGYNVLDIKSSHQTLDSPVFLLEDGRLIMHNPYIKIADNVVRLVEVNYWSISYVTRDGIYGYYTPIGKMYTIRVERIVYTDHQVSYTHDAEYPLIILRYNILLSGDIVYGRDGIPRIDDNRVPACRVALPYILGVDGKIKRISKNNIYIIPLPPIKNLHAHKGNIVVIY